MTLRYDAHKRPIGLDWAVCNDGKNDTHLWAVAFAAFNNKDKPKPKKKRGNNGNGGGAQKSKLNARLEAEIIKMYTTTELSSGDIGKHFEVSRQVVYKVLKRNEIPTRTRSEAMILVRQNKTW